MSANDTVLYDAVLLTITYIGISMQLYVVFVLFSATPDKMKQYRFFLLLYTVCDLAFVIVVGVALHPVPPSDLPCAAWRGVIFRWADRHTSRFGFAIALFCGTAVLSVQDYCILYRGALVWREGRHLLHLLSRKARFAALLVILTFSFLNGFVGYFLTVFEEQNPERYPTLREVMYTGSDAFICISLGKSPIYPMPKVVLPLFICTEVAFFVLALTTVLYIKRASLKMSPKSRRLNLMLSLLLLIQTTTPIISIFVPFSIGMIYYLVSNRVLPADVLMTGFVLFSLFPLINATLTIAFIKPYRDFTVNRLRFPAFFICPKNPDSINQTLIRRDVEKHFPNITDDSLRNLVAYAVAGAGFGNMGPILRKLSVDQLLEIKMQFKEWQGQRNLSVFFHTLFTEYGYTFDELLAECRYGNHVLNCTDLFTSQYTMLRGRCLRLRAFHQYDPAHYGRVFFRVRQVPGWLTAKDGKQRQIIAYVKTPGSEPFTYPRFYFSFPSENYLYLKLQHLKLLDANPNCNKDCLNCHTSTCYHVRWLRRRIWDPHNCTVFYEWRNAKRYPVCEPDVLVEDYDNIENTEMTGEKCLPSCERDVRVIVRHSEMRNTFAPAELRISMYYEHLEYEVLEEISAISLPRFVSELGGQFNLFIGGSVLILVHIGYLNDAIFVDSVNMMPLLSTFTVM